MYKKISDFEDKISTIATWIRNLDMNLETNPTVFSQLQEYAIQTNLLTSSVSGFQKDAKKEALLAIKELSSVTKSLIQIIYREYIEEYIMNIRTKLTFLIEYPHLFVDEFDGENDDISNAIRMHNELWRFVGDIFATSNAPEMFPELCKNNSTLSLQEVFSIVMQLIHKIFDTVIKNVFEDVADWDIERKKQLTQDIRTQYPNASNKYNHILLSKNKWNAIKNDFLTASQQSLQYMFTEKPEAFFSGDFHGIINNLSIFLLALTDEEDMDKIFTKFVSSFLAEQFQNSQQKNTEKQNQERISRENILSVFTSNKMSSLSLTPLSEDVLSDIRSYLLEKKNNGNHEKMLHDIEKILQKLLAKNENIRKQWFKNKINSFGFDCIDDDFFLILEKHNFTCIDDNKISSEIVCDEENDMEIVQTDDNSPSFSQEKNALLDRLYALDADRDSEESKESYINKKILWYIEIFSELGYTYENKKKFIDTVTRDCIAHPRLLKDIRKTLSALIMVNKQEQFKPWRNYYNFPLSQWWRIVLYKKWVISTIWSHDYYETNLKNNI